MLNQAYFQLNFIIRNIVRKIHNKKVVRKKNK